MSWGPGSPGIDDGAATAGPVEPRDRTPDAVLDALRAGNARFRDGRMRHPHQDAARRTDLVAGQRPIAAVLSCSDSRVPPEAVLDRGLGDLFVVRNAGHVLGDDALASVRYAVVQLGVPVVLVLGHESCGAVGLALDAVRDGGDLGAPLIRSIASSARAALEASSGPAEAAHRDAVERHAASTAARLRDDPAIAERIGDGRLRVAAGVYRMESGRIDELDATATA